MPHENGMPTWQELKGMSDEELIRNIDLQFGHGGDEKFHLLVAQCYRDELSRRTGARAPDTMIRYTRQVRDVTLVIVAATLLTLLLEALCRAHF